MSKFSGCLLVVMTVAVVLAPRGALGGSCHEAKLCCPGRDSSCVVQKAPLNAIIEDLNDKPCYCDHACLKLGDCCTDFKEACGVVDCQLSQWGPWSACDADCGPGTMSRSRSVKVQPQNGGRHCPSLEQRRGCQVSTCHHHPDPAIKVGPNDGMIQVGSKKLLVPVKYKEYAEKYANFKVRPTDVWVMGMPRSGTTLTEEMTWLICSDLDFERAKTTNSYKRIPFLESNLFINDEKALKELSLPGTDKDRRNFLECSIAPLEILSETKEKRVIKTHLPFELLPAEVANCKIVYVARNPKDVIVSFYHLHRTVSLRTYVGSFESYFNYYKNGLEIAMLLPGSLSHSRTANATSDIRKNLRLRDPEEYPQYDPQKTYCVEFEILKASKACRKELNYNALKEGERICVRCESEALHENLGWRCQGHGVQGRITRWSALSAPHCHGKWLRAQAEVDRTCTARTCKAESAFIFV